MNGDLHTILSKNQQLAKHILAPSKLSDEGIILAKNVKLH